MNELALYRKYRSSTFDTVVGQSHIVATLKNAVNSGRLSHAYLFTGPRGVGKTSVARLLARSANCTGDGPKPCNKCDNCTAPIGSHLDLLEIDAASHRGIDDARNLRDKISLAPSLGKYKVYIIDEVHMLTTEAFNALLKTIEEPPAHAIFIMATTEAQKLPHTIISRTQRFQFRPIEPADIKKHLTEIAKQEKINIDDDALALMAETAEGSFRDAISLLDQVASSGREKLGVTDIYSLLGWTDTKLIEKIVSAVNSNQALAAIEAIDQAIAQGAQPAQLVNQLVIHYRHTLRQSLKTNDSQTGKQAAAIQALLEVAKSTWPALALEAAIANLTTSERPLTNQTLPPKNIPDRPAVTPSTPEATPTSIAAPDPQSDDLWLKALAQIKQHNNSLYALLRASCTVTFENDELTLGCRFSFHRDRLKESRNFLIIEQALARVYGRKIKVVVQLDKPQPKVMATATDPASELVSSALEILGGEVIE